MKKSARYIEEEKKYARDLLGNVTYDGRKICRFYCTPTGCLRRDCAFVHKKLGCAFHGLAKQGCIYGEEGEFCPFSHDLNNDVIITSVLYPCTETDCKDRALM